jgi:putative ABC transport system permease protein
MKLALRELVRRPGRFVTATAILTLIALLLMFLGGLLDGLIRNSTGALRAQDADVIVYSGSSQASFLRSRIEPATRDRIAALPETSEVGGLGVVQLGARVPGNGPRDLANVAVWGYELAPTGVPDPPAPGEAYADEVLEADGVELGDELLIGPARSPITVVGWVEDTAFNGQGGLWADVDTWRTVLTDNRPDAVLAEGVFQALVVRGSGTTDAATLADAIDADVNGSDAVVLALTVDEAIEEIPGVTEQRTTFNQILGVTIVIALVVIALFFALLTVERTALYGVLKAIGARSGTIFAGLVAQAVVVTLVAAVIGGLLVLVLDLLIPPGSIPLYVSPGRIVTSIALLLVAAVIGCAFSLRRVLRVDPASALGS